MIRSFADSATERVFQRTYVRRWSSELQRVAYRKLVMLDAAENLADLAAAAGNALEKLVGNRAGQHSIRINQQWRICFEWRKSDAFEVEIVDYH